MIKPLDRTGTYRTYAMADGLAGMRIEHIADDSEGCLWFATWDNGVSRFDGDEFQNFTKQDGLIDDRTYKVWIGRFENRDELWCYADGTFESVQVDLGGPLRKIQCDREGRMWISTSEGALYQDGDGFSRFTPADGLHHPAVKAVFLDRDHQYWFATWGGGGLYDAHSISIFDLNKALPKDKKPSEISQIVQDRQGNIWIGCVSPILTSRHQSVARFDGEHFAFIDSEQGFDIDNCFSMYEDHEGYLWFGGLNGLFRYDGQALKKMEIDAGLDERSISTITQDVEDQFLFGYWEKSAYKNKFKKEKLLVSPLKIIYQRGEEFQTIFMEEEKKDVLDRIGTVIAGRNSEIYFHLASHNFPVGGRGLARWYSEDGLKFYGVEDGLIDDRVTDLLEDRDGNLWIATLGGLCRFDGSTFQNFTTEDGLPSNRIRCLFEDRQGHLWLGTDRGVAHYDGQLFQTINSPHIEPVCQILEDRNGTFFFGTTQGKIIRYRQRRALPRIRLLQVIADEVYENSGEVIVSTAGQQLIFEYKGLSFSRPPSDMLYVYRLNGYDADWQLATRKMRAFYRDLPPGDYTFQVRAIDRDLNYSEIAQAQLSITADPRIDALTDVINRRGSQQFIGHSAALHAFQVNLEKIASTNMTVLILGETGVGKGLAARTLHALSANSDGPFIEVSCGALPGALIDSELFGHERGAFTGAVFQRLGRVELAEGGTLFLDEIGDMALETQVKLLRLLEEGTFERVGSSETRMAKTRIVAATNRDLKEMVSTGDFREDLYYRLNAFPMYLPPLREREADIPHLAEFFKARMARHIGKQIDPLTPEIIEMLQSYDWPGNVRELEHTIQRAVVLCPESLIRVIDLVLHHPRIEDTNRDLEQQTLSASQAPEFIPLDEHDRRYILDALEATNWMIKGPRGAAKLLGVPPSTLYSKMKKLGIKLS